MKVHLHGKRITWQANNTLPNRSLVHKLITFIYRCKCISTSKHSIVLPLSANMHRNLPGGGNEDTAFIKGRRLLYIYIIFGVRFDVQRVHLELYALTHGGFKLFVWVLICPSYRLSMMLLEVSLETSI